jgi:hypothetical protein
MKEKTYTDTDTTIIVLLSIITVIEFISNSKKTNAIMMKKRYRI